VNPLQHPGIELVRCSTEEHLRALNDHEPSGHIEWIEDLQAIPRTALWKPSDEQ